MLEASSGLRAGGRFGVLARKFLTRREMVGIMRHNFVVSREVWYESQKGGTQMRKLMKMWFSLFVLQVALFEASEPAISQETTSYEIEPMGDEAYQVLLQFFRYDRDVPLEARVVQREDSTSYIREKIIFTGVQDRVPGYLAIPKTGIPPYPCVLQLHGAGGSKSDWWEGRDLQAIRFTRELLSRGFAVLALDAQYHGERALNYDYEPPMSKFMITLRDVLIQSIVEHRRAIDYLTTRAEIDTTRIGIVGSSMGGRFTYILTAIEPRCQFAGDRVPPVLTIGYHPYPGDRVPSVPG